MKDWNALAFFPESCPNCIGEDGHTTDIHKWQLEQDENLRLSLMSYTQDPVIAVTFVQSGFEVFEEELKNEMEDLRSAYPQRLQTFVRDDNGHTFLLSDTSLTAGGVTVLDWVAAMLEGSNDWISTSD